MFFVAQVLTLAQGQLALGLQIPIGHG